MESDKITHESLPNEIWINVFEYLTLKELVRCSNVCQKWKSLTQEQSLWRKLNLSRKKVCVTYLNKMMSFGVKYLSLQRSKILIDGHFTNETNQELIYLNLYDIMADPYTIDNLLNSCHYVEKLSLGRLNIIPKFVEHIVRFAPTLSVLDLWTCKGNVNHSMYTITNSTRM